MKFEQTTLPTPARASAPAVPPLPAAAEPASLSSSGDNLPVGYLRAFITALVVAHHAVIAYNPFIPKASPGPLNGPSQWWRAFPVIDSQRWAGFSLFNSFNDIFFMALMFFLSGLFVHASLGRKGSGAFLRGRALRLGLPFVVAAGVVAPLAYYPAYLQGGGEGLAGFWRQWRSLDGWPAGPAWFVWVLLAFGAAAAGLFQLFPRWTEALGRAASCARSHPTAFFALLVGVSAVAYVPMALLFTPFAWASFGPFTFQTSRLLFYFVYFLAGVGVGAWGLERGLLAADGRLARRWGLWSTACLTVFVLTMIVVVAAISQGGRSRGLEIGGDLAFVVCCAVSGFCFLALFARFATKRSRVLDSLRDNAYGIYLVHYAFVSWLQLALVAAPLPGLVKGTIVCLGALASSWALVAALRRIPGVARVI
jgi:hypothetical protein